METLPVAGYQCRTSVPRIPLDVLKPKSYVEEFTTADSCVGTLPLRRS